MSKLILVSLFALCATSLMALLTFFQGSAEELGYSLEFEATGFVENFAQQGNHCRTKVAIFEAAQLIGDFTTEDVPRRDDRYILQASGELCQAVNIATIIGGGHIAFYVAKSGQE